MRVDLFRRELAALAQSKRAKIADEMLDEAGSVQAIDDFRLELVTDAAIGAAHLRIGEGYQEIKSCLRGLDEHEPGIVREMRQYLTLGFGENFGHFIERPG